MRPPRSASERARMFDERAERAVDPYTPDERTSPESVGNVLRLPLERPTNKVKRIELLRRPVQKAPRPVGRSGGRLRDAFDDLEIGRQRLALGFRPEQHGDHD